MIVKKFCRRKCCPVIKIDENKDIFITEELTEDNYGGEIKMKKESFIDLCRAIKEGEFDDVIEFIHV